MLQLAQQQDRAQINALAEQLYQLRSAWRPDVYIGGEELYSQTRFDELVKQRCLYTAKMESIIVGYVLLSRREENIPGMRKRRIMTVEEICVAKDLRNQGIGRQIMTDVQALSSAFGCRTLRLGVLPHNDDAVGFFQKCGFTIQMISMEK